MRKFFSKINNCCILPYVFLEKCSVFKMFKILKEGDGDNTGNNVVRTNPVRGQPLSMRGKSARCEKF